MRLRLKESFFKLLNVSSKTRGSIDTYEVLVLESEGTLPEKSLSRSVFSLYSKKGFKVSNANSKFVANKQADKDSRTAHILFHTLMQFSKKLKINAKSFGSPE